MPVKPLIWLPSSRIWPYVMPIFLSALRQVLGDLPLYLFKIKGLPNNKQHWQHVLAYVGPIHCTTGKVREWELSVFLITLSERLISRDSGQVCVVKRRELHKRLNCKQQNGAWDWPTVWPTVKFPRMFYSGVPFWLILNDWFSFVFAFCCSIFLLLTSRQRGSYLTLYAKDFDCNLVALWRGRKKNHQKLTEDKAPSTHRILGN